MNQHRFINATVASAAEICSRFLLKNEVRPLLCDHMGTTEFVGVLLANKQYVTGIDFLAHALQVREAVWWGCLCVHHACGDSLSPLERKACIATVQWVLEPTEKNRAATRAPAEAAAPASPTAQLAMAVIQAGENLVPSNPPPVAPAPFAPAKAVAKAVKLVSTRADPVRTVDTYRLFLELGIGVAEDRFVWPKVRRGLRS